METKRLLIGLALAGMLAGKALASDVQITNDIKDPKKTAILLDIDDTVVVKSTYKGVVGRNIDAFLYCFLRHPVTFFQQIKTGAGSEEWQKTFKGFNKNTNSYEHQFANAIQHISQEKKLLPGMPELLTQLHALGYELQALTNMGEDDYKYLETKHPEIFKKLFSSATYVIYDEKNKKKIKKPNPAYFTNFVESVKQNNKNPDGKTYLFIDDKLENCQVAQKTVGFDYIKVPGNKNNAEFLTNVLRQHGVEV